MPGNTAKIQGRRELDYQSLRDVLADADNLRSRNVKTFGNWSAGQDFRHLAKASNGSIDSYAAPFPWYFRIGNAVVRGHVNGTSLGLEMSIPNVVLEAGWIFQRQK